MLQGKKKNVRGRMNFRGCSKIQKERKRRLNQNRGHSTYKTDLMLYWDTFVCKLEMFFLAEKNFSALFCLQRNYLATSQVTNFSSWKERRSFSPQRSTGDDYQVFFFVKFQGRKCVEHCTAYCTNDNEIITLSLTQFYYSAWSCFFLKILEKKKGEWTS